MFTNNTNSKEGSASKIEMFFLSSDLTCASSVNSNWSSKQTTQLSSSERPRTCVRLHVDALRSLVSLHFFPSSKRNSSCLSKPLQIWPLWYNQTFNHLRQSNVKGQKNILRGPRGGQEPLWRPVNEAAARLSGSFCSAPAPQVRTCCRRQLGFARLVLSHAPVSVNNDYSGAEEVRHSLQGWDDASVPLRLIDIRLELHTCRFDALQCAQEHTTTGNPPGSKQEVREEREKDDPEVRQLRLWGLVWKSSHSKRIPVEQERKTSDDPTPNGRTAPEFDLVRISTLVRNCLHLRQ